MAGIHRVVPADPTLPKVRQQNLELANIWQASLRDIQEASKLGARITEAASQNRTDSGKRENDQNGISEKIPDKRQKILLKVQEQGGESHGVGICVDEKLDRLFTYCANNVGRHTKTDLVFRFDGQQLDADKNPQDLDLEEKNIC